MANPLPAQFLLDTRASNNLVAVANGSVAWGDYDNDGDLDILLTGGHSNLYRNDGGTFTSINAGLTRVGQSSVAWGDYDNDGDLDILLTGLRTDETLISLVYRNDGGGVFTDINAGLPGVWQGSVGWGDYDNDGDPDILLTGDRSADGNHDMISFIYRNDGGTFTNINAGLTGVGFRSSAAWGDYDDDGDLDVLLTGTTNQNNRVSIAYRNDAGSFVNINAGLAGVADGSVGWGDYDNDGDLDILLTGATGVNTFVSIIYRNDGGNFTDIHAGLTAVRFSSAAWGDYDNDGDLDILIAGSTADINDKVSIVYRNDDSTFTDINAKLTAVSDGAVAWGDYNNDNDLDILLTGLPAESPAVSELYRNLSFIGKGDIPQEYALSQNFPNPFNPETTIPYQLPEAVNVLLEVYNLTGQKVVTLVNQQQPAGYNFVVWNGRDQSGRQVSSGLYIYRLQAGSFVEARKMILLH